MELACRKNNKPRTIWKQKCHLCSHSVRNSVFILIYWPLRTYSFMTAVKISPHHKLSSSTKSSYIENYIMDRFWNCCYLFREVLSKRKKTDDWIFGDVCESIIGNRFYFIRSFSLFLHFFRILTQYANNFNFFLSNSLTSLYVLCSASNFPQNNRRDYVDVS